MSLVDAVREIGIKPGDDAPQADKKRYSELLSQNLAYKLSAGLQDAGFIGCHPAEGEKGERVFQGGLGPKRVDVAFSDEKNGLIMAVSIKTICFAPFGKNLKNRFADLCTESITLHLRFPYSIVCALFAFPAEAAEDLTDSRQVSTFDRARQLFATISGRQQYTDPGEKFENVALMLFTPGENPLVKLVNSDDGRVLTESEYFAMLKAIYNRRNPHALVAGDDIDG